MATTERVGNPCRIRFGEDIIPKSVCKNLLMAKKSKPRKRGASKKGASIIQTYGLYWEKDFVEWKSEGRMIGYCNRDGKRFYTNFWDQKGIYILYDRSDQPVYFGQVGVIKHTPDGEGSILGARLLHHKKGDFGDQWSKFSWFGVRPVGRKKIGKFIDQRGERKDLYNLNDRKERGDVEPEIRVMEALLISVNRRGGLNKQEGHWSKIGADRYYQLESDNIRAGNDKEFKLLLVIEERLKALQESMD